MSQCLTRALRHQKHHHKLAAEVTTQLSSPLLSTWRNSSCLFADRRHFTTTDSLSSTSITTASDAASLLLSSLSSSSPTTRRQLLDGNQLQRLSLTLNRPNLHPDLPITDLALGVPPSGTPLPPGYHLVYFTPGGLESELGPDGTDRTFNAPAPFTRRMWAGGKMTWTPGKSLKVGEVAEEKTRLLNAVAKKSKSGGEMVLVDVEKEFWGEDGLVLVDQRSWIFRPELEAANSKEEIMTKTKVVRGPSRTEDFSLDGETLPRRRHLWSPTALFRFSALTFNGHKIHYDQSWSSAVENHAPGVVVHGPLNLVCMLDYYRDIISKESASAGGGVGGSGEVVREIKYRAMSPLYAGQEYEIRATPSEGKGVDGDKEWDVVVERDGTVCMKASITTAAV